MACGPSAESPFIILRRRRTGIPLDVRARRRHDVCPSGDVNIGQEAQDLLLEQQAQVCRDTLSPLLQDMAEPAGLSAVSREIFPSDSAVSIMP